MLPSMRAARSPSRASSFLSLSRRAKRASCHPSRRPTVLVPVAASPTGLLRSLPYDFLIAIVKFYPWMNSPMPRWIVSCPECDHEFTFQEVADTPSGQLRDPFAWPPKPVMANGGTPLPCPNCHKTSRYQTFDLRFRAH